MNTETKEDIKNEKNIQYFLDVAYYATPPIEYLYYHLIQNYLELYYNNRLFFR